MQCCSTIALAQQTGPHVGQQASGTRPRLVVQLGHFDEIGSVAFSPNGQLILTGSRDGSAGLWDAATGAEIRRFEGHAGQVWAVAFSPDGQSVLTGGRDNARLWSAESGQEIRRFQLGSGSVVGVDVWSVAFSPDARFVLLGTGDGGPAPPTVPGETEPYKYINDKTARLYEIASGCEIQKFQGHTGRVSSVAFSPDGKTVLTGSGDKTARLWELSTGREIRTFQGHLGGISSAAFSTDGKFVLTGSSDKTAALWNTSTGQRLRNFGGHRDGVSAIAFSPDGLSILTISWNARLWSTASGTEIRTYNVRAESGAFSPDGHSVLLGGRKNAYLLDTKSGREIQRLEGRSLSVTSMSPSPDGRLLLSGTAENTVCLWDLTTGQEWQRFEDRSGANSPSVFKGIAAVAFSPDGKWLASASWDAMTRVWSSAGHAIQRSIWTIAGPVVSLAFSPDGKYLATDRNDGAVRLLNLATGQEVRRFQIDRSQCQRCSIRSVAFSPDGRFILTGGWDERVNGEQSVRLWDVATGLEVRRFLKSFNVTYQVAFSPDGQMILAGGWAIGSPVTLVNAATGVEIRRFRGYSPASFSPDGRSVVTSGRDVTQWDIATGREVRRFEGHAGAVTSVTFSPDGKFLLTASTDNTIRFWNAATGEELCRLISLYDGNWVTVTPEGRFDTNNLEEIRGLHWVMPDDPMRALPLEIFMRDYYEPQLLPRLLKCNQLNNCAQEFKPVRDITRLSRVQPRVEIKNVSIPDANGYGNVTLEIGRGEGKGKQGKNVTSAGEVFDLRLFRDGQMVAYWPQDGGERRLEQSAKDLGLGKDASDEARLLQEELGWRQATRVPLNSSARNTLAARVRLPKGKDISKTEFTAYAFNEDRVKSQTAKWTWPSNLVGNLPPPRTVKPRAYIVNVGVNASENPSWRLQYAVNDALKMQQILADKLKRLKQPDGVSDRYEVIALPLVSDYNTDGTTLKLNDATKKKIRAVIDVLAGRKADANLLSDLKANAPQVSQLKKAEPDDLILISFSSHGYADRSGNFFLLPYDIGSSSQITPELLLRSISSDELSLWLRDVDAGEMVMIIDACHAAAFTGKDFKPGPMGSRGLGQLAYDKGMRILTATQANDFALESGALSQGLLSYALLENGLREGRADFKPTPDGKITMKEWLEFGAVEVPALYEKIRRRELKVVGEGARAVIAMPAQRSEGYQQRPSLFDFARKRPDVVLTTTRTGANTYLP